MVAAGVPGRGEYWNMKAPSKRASRTTSSVASKSASVSPGNPTMMSVETLRFGMMLCAISSLARNRSACSPGASQPGCGGCRLQRQVELLAHRRRLRHRRGNVLLEVLRVGARVADAADPFDLADPAQQIGEQRLPAVQLEIATVRVDVLAEQRHLDHPVGGELADLAEHVAGAAGDLCTSHDRNDAERARVVAADRDGHPRRVRGLAVARQRRGNVVDRDRLVPDLGDRAPLLGVVEQIDDAMGVVGAEHDVDPRCPFLDRLLVLLGHAPADDDLHRRLAALHSPQGTEIAVQLLVGVLADGAGVEHDNVGIFWSVGRRHAIRLEQPADPLGVVLVHLAPEGPDEVALTRPRLRPRGLDGWHAEHDGFGHEMGSGGAERQRA